MNYLVGFEKDEGWSYRELSVSKGDNIERVILDYIREWWGDEGDRYRDTGLDCIFDIDVYEIKNKIDFDLTGYQHTAKTRASLRAKLKRQKKEKELYLELKEKYEIT